MREVDSNVFLKWADELPTPDELMPVTQSLITPHLALAFDIGSHDSSSPSAAGKSPVPPTPSPRRIAAELGGGDSARTLKRPRLVWTPELHKRFVDAVTHLGIKNAVPKTIMQLMSVDGLTRENVASHLQKYRLYLKRMHGPAVAAAASSASDLATEHLFATSPIPPQFLNAACRVNPDQILPFMRTSNPHPHPHHIPQLGIIPSAHPQFQRSHHLHQHHQIARFNSPPSEQFEYSFFMRPPRPSEAPFHGSVNVEDLESVTPTGGRKALTLFPSAGD